MARISITRILSRFTPVLLGAGLFSLAAAGCVSQEDYMALKMERDNLSDQVAGANAKAAHNEALAASLRAQLASLGTGDNIDDAMVANLNKQIAELTGQRDELASMYDELLNKVGSSALPQPLVNELNLFAAANPDLVEFDEKLGIVKFKSDLTFASGDAELTSEAKAVIGKFAQILNGDIARAYRLEIAGHTDNVPVESGLTKSKGHKDNWYLSSHRAISVAQALISQSVAKTRIGVTGYADQRPVASNDNAAGKQQNRRVEVLILPTTVAPPATAELPTTPDAEMAGAPADMPTK